MEDDIQIVEWTNSSGQEKESIKLMEWPNEDTEQLIDLFREHPILWNSNKSGFKVNAQKSEAWENIAKIMGKSSADVRRKMNSLMASFRRERLKRIRSNNPLLPQEGDQIKTTWFGYKKMLFMIESDRYKYYNEDSMKYDGKMVRILVFNYFKIYFDLFAPRNTLYKNVLNILV